MHWGPNPVEIQADDFLMSPLQLYFTLAFTKSLASVQIQSTSAARLSLPEILDLPHLNSSGKKKNLALLTIPGLGHRAISSLPIAHTQFSSNEALQNKHLTSYAYIDLSQ